MKNFGNKRVDSSDSAIVASIDDSIKQEKLRLALLRTDNGNGTENDRKLIRDARRGGVDLDSIRNRRDTESSQQPRSDGTGRRVGRKSSQDLTIADEMNRGNFPFEGRAIPFQVLSRTTTRTEDDASSANSAVVEGQVDGIQGAEDSMPFTDAMDELAGAWREMSGGSSRGQTLFVVPVSSEDFAEDAPADEPKIEQSQAKEGGVYLNGKRPAWPSREVTILVPRENDHIIDPWNNEKIEAGEGVFRIPRRENAAGAGENHSEVLNQPNGTELLSEEGLRPEAVVQVADAVLPVLDGISPETQVFASGNAVDSELKDGSGVESAPRRVQRRVTTPDGLLATLELPWGGKGPYIPRGNVGKWLDGADRVNVGVLPVRENGTLIIPQSAKGVEGRLPTVSVLPHRARR